MVFGIEGKRDGVKEGGTVGRNKGREEEGIKVRFQSRMNKEGRKGIGKEGRKE